MITPSDVRVWDATCDRCHRPDWPTGRTEGEALADLRSDGWRLDPMVCPSCQADEGLTDAQIAAGYRENLADGIPAPWGRSGL